MKYIIFLAAIFFFTSSKCNKGSNDGNNGGTTTPTKLQLNATYLNNVAITLGNTQVGCETLPQIKLVMNNAIDKATVASSVSLLDGNGNSVQLNFSYANGDSTLIATAATSLKYLSQYTFNITSGLKTTAGGTFNSPTTIVLNTKVDPSPKFATITDEELLTLVQRQTFKYFWDFGHPVSGLARERNNGSNNDVVTTGGSGFGIMAMVVGVERGFITRTQAVERLTTITKFLSEKCTRWHGAFSHWLNGATGVTVPFGNNNGADIVETSYLMQGLLTARQYFNQSSLEETTLRDSINSIWNKVEWNWFTQNGAVQSLYWQYNPSYSSTSDIWSIPISGWNECLITYVLAASSTNYSITKTVYDVGWTKNGAIKNGNTYYGNVLPLGETLGGPLFFEQYSFLGINPNSLTDANANYWTQAVNHSKINHGYCVANPKNFYGYADSCWGLTASDIMNGYTASSPTNDQSFIAPTAALSSMPFTPQESMKALKYFYYTLGDKIWKDYGFVDAFSLQNLWYANSYLAIDQGPIICMIENYRTGLLWNLFTSCPEVKTGMKNLGFSASYL